VVGEAKFAKLQDEDELDKTLALLEDRGLLGRDPSGQPIRLAPHCAWSGLEQPGRQYATHHLRSLGNALQFLPTVDLGNVDCLEDLTGAIELYNTLIGLGRY
jgi:hypothetical protein